MDSLHITDWVPNSVNELVPKCREKILFNRWKSTEPYYDLWLTLRALNTPPPDAYHLVMPTKQYCDNLTDDEKETLLNIKKHCLDWHLVNSHADDPTQRHNMRKLDCRDCYEEAAMNTNKPFCFAELMALSLLSGLDVYPIRNKENDQI